MKWHDLKIFITQSLLVAVLFIVFLGGGYVLRQRAMDRSIDVATYQVVTLRNGRTYFGSLEGLGKEYIVLRNVFFFQTAFPNEATDEGEEDVAAPSEESQVSLQRMSSLAYRPENDLYIHTDDLVSWQNLDKDSRVVEAIQEYFATQEEDKQKDVKEDKEK